MGEVCKIVEDALSMAYSSLSSQVYKDYTMLIGHNIFHWGILYFHV